MKSLVSHTAAITLLLAGGATAADIRMPVKAPPPAAVAVYNWTGCYVGAGGGYGMFNQRIQTVFNGVPFGLPGDLGGRGWFGTVQGGCDYQVSSNIVVGAFADYDLSAIKGDMGNGQAGFFGSEKLKSSWAAGGRIGWLVSPRFLTYVSAGYTEAHFGRVDFVNIFNVPQNRHLVAHTYTGWFVGAGYEYNLGWLPGLFWKTEYRFADYGTDRVPILVSSTGAHSGVDYDLRKYTHSVRSELVWRFNAGGGATALADASMPVKAPSLAAAAYNWTGCFVGAGGGYGMYNQDSSITFVSTVKITNGGRGWFGTVQTGCDYQFSPNVVAGAFVDYDFSGIKGTMIIDNGVGLRGEEKLKSSWAAGGRIGWLPLQPLLAYVSAGYTEARFSRVDPVNAVGGGPSGTYVPAHTYTGWFLGAGYEYALAWMPGLFWKTEYRFADYGTGRPNLLNVGNNAVFVPIDFDKYVQTVRTEVVWRFNFGGGPVVARN
jgi:outer membrane immunogenic protein